MQDYQDRDWPEQERQQTQNNAGFTHENGEGQKGNEDQSEERQKNAP
jgi:hypothetical protein